MYIPSSVECSFGDSIKRLVQYSTVLFTVREKHATRTHIRSSMRYVSLTTGIIPHQIRKNESTDTDKNILENGSSGIIRNKELGLPLTKVSSH